MGVIMKNFKEVVKNRVKKHDTAEVDGEKFTWFTTNKYYTFLSIKQYNGVNMITTKQYSI